MRGLAIAVGALLTTAGTAGAAAAGPVLVSGQLGGAPFATKTVAAQTLARTAVAGAAAAALTYAPPVAPMRVLRGFEPPSSPYGPGHRGVDLALGQGGLVAAAGDGAVSFAGLVAGRGVVVLAHTDGISTEYEPVVPVVRAGTTVGRGQPVGRLSGLHTACAPASCLHWGARRGSSYVDPLSLLRPLGPVRLLPWPR